jgi:hypothetical protein
MLWNGNECGKKNLGNENLQATIRDTDIKTTGECGIFRLFE